jgi:thiamine biosynthesis lipoprotein
MAHPARRLNAAPIACLAAVLACASCDSPEPPAILAGATMGSTWSVRLRQPPADADALRALLQRWLDGFESQASTWRPDSTLSRFNASAGADWTPISADLAAVIRHAQGCSQMTGGAFDITVASEPGSIDFRRLQLRGPEPAIRKLDPGIKLDVCGVAPGYAADHLALMLRHAGVRDFLIDVGGELRADGAWIVGVESPDRAAGAIAARITLRDESLSTSATHRSSTFLDPRTGRPADHQPPLLSVSVIHRSAAAADALATAIMVMGPAEGLAFASEQELPALLIVRESGSLRHLTTAAWSRRLSRGAPE